MHQPHDVSTPWRLGYHPLWSSGTRAAIPSDPTENRWRVINLRRWGGRSAWRALGVVALAFLLPGCGVSGSEPGACDRIADKRVWVSRSEYLPCAAEILAAMDSLRPLLDAVDRGDAGARSEAQRQYRQLDTLMRKAGFLSPEELQMREARGQATYRWFIPNEKVVDGGQAVDDLNRVLSTARQFLAPEIRTLVERNQGRSAHDRAKALFAEIR